MPCLSLSARFRLPLSAVVCLAFLAACSDQSSELPTGPQLQPAASAAGRPDIEAARQAKAKYLARLMATPGVVGVGIGLNPAGRAVVKIFTERPGVGGIPPALDQVPVAVEVTGRAYALSDPTTRQRPAPIGFSVGHPDITAGTIGARVKDALGQVYVLSNNHVLAAANGGLIGDATLQPGPYDGGTAGDQIGTLFAYEVLNLGYSGYGVDPPSNLMDAAIALSTTTALGNSTPLDDGYGAPNPLVYGDTAPADGMFDDPSAPLNLLVEKYGRTTKLTHGQVTEVNVTIDVCYDFFCFTVGRFNDQVAVCCAGFSDGGDSGSLIVSDDGNRNPVALLFAGDGIRTYGNRIDLVLQKFGVTIDGSASSPPPPPPPPADAMHVGDLDGSGISQGRTWKAVITVLIQDAGGLPVSGAQVTGTFGGSTKACTTGSTGVCTLTKTKLRTATVSFTVTGVTHSTLTYNAAANVDPDGSSDGTTVTVARP